MPLPITPLLRKALMFDAVVTGAAAALMIAGSTLLGPMLNLPAPLLLWAGVLLVPFVAFLVVLAKRETAPWVMVVDVVLINVAWVIASFGVLVAGLFEPNALGVAFISVQAVAVALFAALQASALKAARSLAA